MTDSVKINGIRLNKKFIQVTQDDILLKMPDRAFLYEALESRKINMVCMILNTMGNRTFVSGTIASKNFGQDVHTAGDWQCNPDICTVSVYPHHHRLEFLGLMLQLLGEQKHFFHYMVSSNSMLTLVQDEDHSLRFTKMLSDGFDLPRSHAPFEQEENDEQALFVKKRYPETRATYIEEKIKTYGMVLTTDLNLNIYEFSFEHLSTFGQRLRSLNTHDCFSNVSAYMTPDQQIHLFLLTGKPQIDLGQNVYPAELLSFHGPHFGDRHGIMSRTLQCLQNHEIPVLQACCTGASIHILLQKGRGTKAKQALTTVFENP